MIKITGRDILKKRFAILSAEVRREIMKAMEDAAEMMVDLAKSLVPKDTHELEESIGWTWGDAPRGAMTLGSVQGTQRAGDLKITIYAGDSVAYYARWVEFGTGPHNSAKGGGTVLGKVAALAGAGIAHPGTRAQPFFFVSYRAVRKPMKSKVKRAVNRAARKAASG